MRTLLIALAVTALVYIGAVAALYLLAFGAAWVASPIDLIPEFIPVLGPLDDAVVAALILRHLLRTAGRDVIAEHWHGDPGTLARLLRLVGSRAAPRQSGSG